MKCHELSALIKECLKEEFGETGWMQAVNVREDDPQLDDPEVHVPGYGTMKESRLRQRIKEGLADAEKHLARGDIGGLTNQLGRGGVTSEFIQALYDHLKQYDV